MIFLLLLSSFSVEAAKNKKKAAKKNDFDHTIKDPFEASVAFGKYLLALDSLVANDTYAKISLFAKRKGMVTEAALLLISNSESTALNQLIEKCIQSKNSWDHKLAASILLSNALIEKLKSQSSEEDYTPSEALEEVEGDEKENKNKNKKKNNNKKNDKVLTLNYEVLPKLILKKDETTSALAILSAVYTKHLASTEGIKSLRSPKKKQLAASLLYRVLVKGEKIEAKELNSIWLKVKKPSDSISVASTKLYQNYLVVPAAAIACEAFAELKTEAAIKHLEKAIWIKDVRVQIEAVRAIGKMKNPELIKGLYKLMQKCAWPVLVEICKTLGEVPNKATIPVILKMMEKEEGRFRLDLEYTLSCIVGADKGYFLKDWQKWWKENEDTFEIDLAASEAYRLKNNLFSQNVKNLGMFYGLGIYSDKMCYVVDSSNSMKGGRIDALRPDLIESVENLNSVVEYNIVDFGKALNTLYKGSLTSNRKLGTDYVKIMQLTGSTRTYDALDSACLIPEVDTIMFLSDGAPTKGQQIQKWQEIRDALLLQLRYYPIAIFSIDFQAGGANLDHMQGMALENSGQFESIAIEKNEKVAKVKKKKK